MSLVGTTITITPIEPTDAITVTPNNTAVTATSDVTTITLSSSIPSFGAVQATSVTLGTMTGTLQGTGNVELALQKLADQHFKGTEAPTSGTTNLEEGDFFYDTDDNQLKVYRETSPGTLEFVPLAQGTGTMDILDAGSF
jgi:hypothetical protein